LVSDIVRLRQTYISGKKRYCPSTTDVIDPANPKPNPKPTPNPILTLTLPVTLTLTLTLPAVKGAHPWLDIH